ncbi:MAG TPA: ribonuclease J, partial [Clostridiales bacterium]|nr:ribonuclease J [Clostridiales bacterium]
MKTKPNKHKLFIRFLGGVGEIGKNMTAFEYGKDIIIVDAGLAFPTEDMPGIDLVIQDISYLIANKDRVRGVVLTHGHEDHIGGLPYLLKELKIPVFGTKLTLTLAENKMREHKISDYNFNCVTAGSIISLGCFKVEFINVNHSITGACALAITTPVGVIFHSGDFKIDLTPINGQVMDITRISEIGKKGVLLLMCESTNVERTGYAPSETVVGATFDRLFAENVKKRIIIATFSSNVHRLQQILNIAQKYKRKVAFSGRSMINVAEAASKIGELTIPENILVDIERSKNFADKDIVIVSTGSQGEPMSVLTRMAYGDYPQVKITPNDAIIISASPIPGNEKNVYKVINNLYKMGAEVYYESLEKIHVSGHAFQEELKILHSLIKPKFFIPVHGEYRHLKKHILLAKGMGMKESNTLIAEIGDTVELTAKSMKKGEPFQ